MLTRGMLLVVLFFSLFATSCQKELFVEPNQEKTEESPRSRAVQDDEDWSIPDGTPIVLGQKLENPYSLENMQTVVDALLNPNKRVSARGAGDGGDGGNGGNGDGGGSTGGGSTGGGPGIGPDGKWTPNSNFYVWYNHYYGKGIFNGFTYNYPNSFNHQNWTINDEYNEYSSLFIDLMDDNNQFEYYKLQNPNSTKKYPIDNVKGYTVRYLNSILKSIKKISDLKEILLTSPKPTGVTNVDIENLFVEYLKL